MKIKFMGSSHRHVLVKGDTFGGRLSEGLSKEVVFDRSNNWIVDSDDAGLSQEAVDVLVGTESFKDVTDLKSIPTNQHQQIFLGMGKSVKGDGPDGEDDEDAPRGQNLPEGGEAASGTSEVDPTPGTTVGGSTRGSRSRGGTS